MEGKPRDSLLDQPNLNPSAETNGFPDVRNQIANEVEQQLSVGNGQQDIRSNFRIALDELFGKRKEEFSAPTAAVERKNEEVSMSDFDTLSGFGKELKSAARQSFSSITQPGGTQTSVISSGTIIEGRIISDGHLQVAGTVKGDIAAKGNIRITGSVEGDVTGDLIDLNACTVTGNIKSESAVNIDNGSRIIGDITSDELVLDGSVNGNLNVANSAVLKVHASLRGNITASTLSVEQGATISGEVKIERKQID